MCAGGVALGLVCLKNRVMEREKKDILISELMYKYLRGALKGDEADILEAWLQKPEHAEFFMNLQQSGRLYEGLEKMEYLDVLPAWQQLGGRIKAERRRRWLRYLTGMAAVLAVGVMCGWWGWKMVRTGEKDLPARVALNGEWPETTVWKRAGQTVYLADTVKELVLPQEDGTGVSEKTVEYGELQTAFGDRIGMVLADGTRLWLNGGSRLKYPACFEKNRREVVLSGEAYFEVAKDTLRPFIVRTAVADIEVLGTSFNVAADEESEWVATLVEGRVQVSDGSERGVVLSPGQQARQNRDGLWEVREVDTRYYTAWKEGLFAFKDCPLREILGRLARHYGVEFVLEDEALGDLTYTTMTEQCGQVENVLRILEYVGDFYCERVDGKAIFNVKRKTGRKS